MKQTIEIDVPDGYEIDFADLYEGVFEDKSGAGAKRAYVQFKKKDPEYIECRSYLYRNLATKKIVIETTQSIDEEAIKHYEKSKGFIRWVDKEPRKIYIEEQAAYR